AHVLPSAGFSGGLFGHGPVGSSRRGTARGRGNGLFEGNVLTSFHEDTARQDNNRLSRVDEGIGGKVGQELCGAFEADHREVAGVEFPYVRTAVHRGALATFVRGRTDTAFEHRFSQRDRGRATIDSLPERDMSVKSVAHLRENTDHSSGDQHIHEENASGTATGLTPSERESSPKISLFEALASREKGGGSALVDVKRTGRLSGMA